MTIATLISDIETRGTCKIPLYKINPNMPDLTLPYKVFIFFFSKITMKKKKGISVHHSAKHSFFGKKRTRRAVGKYTTRDRRVRVNEQGI